MLKKIERSDFDALVAFVRGYNAIALDEETGAELSKTDGQYCLLISRNPYKCRHWSRRKVRTDEAAIERAQRVLEQENKENER